MQDLQKSDLARPQFSAVLAPIPGFAAPGGACTDRAPAPRSGALSLNLIRLLLVAVACAQIIDVISTNQALAANPGAFEANPVMRLLMSGLGSWWWLWKAGLAAFFLAAAVRIRKPTRRQLILSGAMVKIYALALINNFLF